MEQQLIVKVLKTYSFSSSSDEAFPIGGIRGNNHQQEVTKNIFLWKQLITLFTFASNQSHSELISAIVHPGVTVEDILP
jgi:hypothetical protein